GIRLPLAGSSRRDRAVRDEFDVTESGVMADTFPPCPECGEAYAYEQGALLVCPMCGHEWNPHAAAEPHASDADARANTVIRDAVGNKLADGDTVSVVKDLKIKGGGGGVVKLGTKVQDIRLIEDGVDGHDIDATVPGF